MPLYLTWTGAISENPNDNKNWTAITTYPAGWCLSPYYATRSPGHGDYIYFSSFTAGLTTYPQYTAGGTLYNGAGSCGNTVVANILYTSVSFNHLKGMGTSGGTYFNFCSSQVNIAKGTTNPGSQLFNMNFVGLTPSSVSFSGCVSSGATYNIRGTANIKVASVYQNPFTYGSINCIGLVGNIGPFESIQGNEKIYLDKTTSNNPTYPMVVKGKNNKVYIEKGHSTYTDSPIVLDATANPNTSFQYLEFRGETFDFNASGVTGPDVLQRSTISLKTIGSSKNDQSILVDHGVDFQSLILNSGTINFTNPVNQPTRIFEGSAVSLTSYLYMPNKDCAIFMTPVNEYKGFFIKNTGIGNFDYPVPIYTGPGTTVRIALTVDDNSVYF